MTKTEKQSLEELKKEIRRAFASSGGHARAKALTAEEQSKIGRKAAKARWAKAQKAASDGR